VLVARGRDLGRSLSSRDLHGASAALRPLALVLVPAGLLVAKGALDVRFHLLYGPVLLVHSAAALAAWPTLLEKGRPVLFWSLGLVTWAYVAWTLTAPHTAPTTTQVAWMVVGAALAVPAFVRSPKPRPMVRLALLPLAVFVFWATLTQGPLDWGRRWAWEPSPLPSDIPRAVETFPNVDLQLVRCALGRESVGEARPYLVRALDRHPGDRETVLEVGEALLRGGKDDVRLSLAALGELSRRNPEDAEARNLLEKAVNAAEGP
jgi:hypothetical protein